MEYPMIKRSGRHLTRLRVHNLGKQQTSVEFIEGPLKGRCAIVKGPFGKHVVNKAAAYLRKY